MWSYDGIIVLTLIIRHVQDRQMHHFITPADGRNIIPSYKARYNKQKLQQNIPI